MLKTVIKHGALYTVADGLFGVVHIGLFFLASHYLVPEEMGAVEMIYSLIILIQMAVALEIAQATGRFMADADAPTRRKLISTAFWFTCAMHAGFLLIVLPFSDVISLSLLGDGKFGKLFQIGFIAAVCFALYYYVRSQLRWLLQARVYTFGMLLYVVLAGGIGVVLLRNQVWSSYAIFLSIIGASIPPILMGLWRFRDSIFGGLSGRYLRRMLVFSIPLVPSSIAVFLSQYADRLVLTKLSGLEDVGFYSMGSKLAMLVLLGVLGFQGALTPLIYKNYTKAETPKQLDRVFRWFLWMSLSMLLATGIFAPEAASILFPGYLISIRVVPWLGLANIFSRMYVYSPGLSIKKKTRTFAVIFIGGAILNIVLNFLLIPVMGIQGAALATCLSAGLTAGVFFWRSLREYIIPIQWVRVLISLALLSGFCVATSNYSFLGQGMAGFWGVAGVKAAGLLVGIAILQWILIDTSDRKAFRRTLTGALRTRFSDLVDDSPQESGGVEDEG